MTLDSEAFRTPREAVVESGDFLLAVRDYGGEHKPALLMLHGSGNTLEAWNGVAAMLASSFRVVTYDAPGHGQPQAPREALDLSHFLNAIDDVVAALQLERPILVGHSLGGVVVLLYAAERRAVRGVVSVDGAYLREVSDASYQAPSEQDVLAADVGWIGSAEEFDRKCNEFPAGPARASFRRSHRLRSDGRLERRPSVEFAHAMSRVAGSVEARVTSDVLYASITGPVLLVCGEHGWVQGEPLTADLRERVNGLPARFPHVQVGWLDSGHMMPWERPMELAHAITAFAQER